MELGLVDGGPVFQLRSHYDKYDQELKDLILEPQDPMIDVKKDNKSEKKQQEYKEQKVEDNVNNTNGQSSENSNEQKL